MNEEHGRYLRAKSIVLSADELAVEEQDAFVQAQCGNDVTLLEQVRGLLSAIAADGAGTDLPGWFPQPAACLAGSRLEATSGSSYRIKRSLGRGGMGVVYLAERTLGGSVQKVALKLLDGSLRAVPGMHERFEREALILATLSHANIARLLDAGNTREGHPFLAMEYVEGERIDRWCTSRALALEDTVRLFIKVCAAVQYAHQHLVIHRDIKPANILVDEGGEPRLLDFGIARLLDAGEAATRTETGYRALTLAYASPEQIRNETLSTASDVWQLGVVLYELVSGVRPFPQSESPLTLSHAILGGQVPPPSRACREAVDAGSRDRGRSPVRVPADIDAIVMKAMRALPGERYAGAADLADDLGRWLDARPVLARRGQRWYRARRFVHRHRGAVAATAVIVALLGGFAVEREAQLHRTGLERDKAQALAGFMGELFDDADPTRTQGNRITVAEALDRGVERLRGDTGLEPEARASLLLSIGRGYTALDMGHRAIPLLREADAILERTGATPLEHGRGKAALRRAYSMALDTFSATVAGREAIELLERAPGAHPDEILRVRINLLFDHLTVGDMPLDAIIAELEEVVDGLQSQQGSDRELLIQALAALAMAHMSAGGDAVAAGHAGRALSTAREIYGPEDPALAYYRFTATLTRIREDPADAARAYRQQVADYERMNDGPTPGLGALLAHFGWALDYMGQHEESIQTLQRAERVTGRFADVSPDFHLHVLSSLAAQYHRLGRDDEALMLLRPQLPRMAERARAGTSWGVNSRIRGLNVLGAVALGRGDGEGAANHFLLALEQARYHPQTVRDSLRTASLHGLCSVQGYEAEECK